MAKHNKKDKLNIIIVIIITITRVMSEVKNPNQVKGLDCNSLNSDCVNAICVSFLSE